MTEATSRQPMTDAERAKMHIALKDALGIDPEMHERSPLRGFAHVAYELALERGIGGVSARWIRDVFDPSQPTNPGGPDGLDDQGRPVVFPDPERRPHPTMPSINLFNDPEPFDWDAE